MSDIKSSKNQEFEMTELSNKKSDYKSEKQHVFIIGSKGIPAKYGGFETFVEKLTEYRQAEDIEYHVACMAEDNEEFVYNNAKCFNVNVPNIGAAKAVYYDLAALNICIKHIKKQKIKKAIIYILACRIGPFIGNYKKQIQNLGGHLFVNPDGHEWKRDKWSAPIRKYWKISERLMIKHSGLVICDSKNIKKYICEEYRKYSPNTTYIAYGADTSRSGLADDDIKVTNWYKDKKVSKKNYYLVVGRFVPENNYETMIREFMKSETTKDFVLVTGIEGNVFYDRLRAATGFEQDSRIKFVGTIYDQELLKKIRENAYGYFHGHEVGGTNPSLLEALGSTDLNLLLDVGFNREVGEDGAIYWNKDDKNLAGLILEADRMSENDINTIGQLAKKRITDWYNWEYIVSRYEEVFLSTK